MITADYKKKGIQRMVLRRVFALVLFLLAGYSLKAQALQINSSADTILIGDIFSFEMKVVNTENSKVFFPQFKDTIGNEKIEIIESFPEDTLENGFSKKWNLSIYYPGVFQVKGFSAVIQNEHGNVDTIVSSEPLSVYVNTLEVDTSKAFKPIKAHKTIPYPLKEVAKKVAPYIVGLLAILVILFYLWYRYKNKDVPKYIKPKTALDYHKEAIGKLREIERQKIWQEGNVKEYYLEISETLRTYLEGRFGVNAMESTTDEIIEDFNADKNNQANSLKLKEVLQQCDLAKFAKFKPQGEDNMKMMKMAQNFVSHTKPKPELKEENDK